MAGLAWRCRDGDIGHVEYLQGTWDASVPIPKHKLDLKKGTTGKTVWRTCFSIAAVVARGGGNVYITLDLSSFFACMSKVLLHY